MTDKEFKFNLSVMQEMGLEEGDRRRVIDQDTGEYCIIGNKEIVTPKSQAGKNAVEFDAIYNSRMMSKLFSDFVDKLSEEGEIEGCISFGSYEDKHSGMMSARAMLIDGSIINSKPYKNESLCYVDLVKQLNGEDNVDLSEYDKKKVIKNEKSTRSKRTQNKK